MGGAAARSGCVSDQQRRVYDDVRIPTTVCRRLWPEAAACGLYRASESYIPTSMEIKGAVTLSAEPGTLLLSQLPIAITVLVRHHKHDERGKPAYLRQ